MPHKYKTEDIKQAKDYYKKEYEAIDNKYQRENALLSIDYFDALIDTVNGEHIVDVGIAYGISTNYMYERLKAAESRVKTFIMLRGCGRA